MQNKQAIIGIIAAAIILLGAGAALLYSKNTKEPNQNVPTPTKEEKKEPKTESNIIEILKSSQTQQCDFKSDEGDMVSSGAVYFNNQNLRADFTIKDKNKESAVSMIRKGNNNYIWGSAFPNNAGVKMTLSMDEFEKSDQTKDYLDPNKKVDYKCKPWTLDISMFNPPSNIKFQDLSEMMKGSTGSSSSCSVCNSLTGDEKTACLTSLNCQ